ncbi:uncharacterized protein LOC129671070 [Psammomys obesus]|uniref:uncharacterized protein LOC129671070 n=1 Tax=Psammomys obesus TaxID=48139 RepID=UPI002452BB3B|nr:uncharacterized protein LOC129671070 [Psammomys obesus]
MSNSFDSTESVIVSEHLPKKHDVSNLAVIMDKRREIKTNTEMEGPCKETSTEDERKYDRHESVQSLRTISEPTAQEDDVHLPKPAAQRRENGANGRMKVFGFLAEPNFYVSSREEQNKDDGSDTSPSLVKQRRKRRASNKMNTAKKPSYGNTASAAAADDDDDDDETSSSNVGGHGEANAAAVAISDTSVRNGSILQTHCRKAHTKQFPVTHKKHVGLNKKTSDEKNKAVEHIDAMNDDQLSESLSEDYDLPDYDNILMIVDQLQMNYKDSGKLLGIQDAVHSYKMIIERNRRHSELLIEKSKNLKSQDSTVPKKPRERRKAKLQLRYENEEQQVDLVGVGLAGKQEAQQRNAHYFYAKIKKQLTEKEEKHKREKQRLKMCLIAQDMELRHLRNDMNKLQEAWRRETEAEDSGSMTKEHLRKVEEEVSKLIETIRKQSETIEQLELKLPSEEKKLARTGHLTQAGQELLNSFRENYITSVMSQLELRIQHLEKEISEMKIQTRNDGMMLENFIKLHQSHRLRETEAKLKEVTAQFVMLIQHNSSLLNILSSQLASQSSCFANFHTSSGNLFTQENVVAPAPGPQSSNHCIATSLGVPADDGEDFNKALAKLVPSAQSQLDQTKKKHVELAKEKAPSNKCFKPTKPSTVHDNDNGERSFSEVLNTKQFEMDIPFDIPQHELRAENGETFDNTLGGQNASFINPWEFSFRNLQPEQPEEQAYQASCKAEPKPYKEPCLEREEKTNSSSHKQLKSKEGQDKSPRRPFEEMETSRSALDTHTLSPVAGLTASGSRYDSWGHNRRITQREPLIPSSRPQPLTESVASFLNRVREEHQRTVDDIIGNRNASCIRPQESAPRNPQRKHTQELPHQASNEAEPKRYEDPYLERVEATKSLAYQQLMSKVRQDEAMRKNFEKMEPYGSVPNTGATSPAPRFATERLCNGVGHSGGIAQREPAVMPSSRPWHFVESLDNYLCRDQLVIESTRFHRVQEGSEKPERGAGRCSRSKHDFKGPTEKGGAAICSLITCGPEDCLVETFEESKLLKRTNIGKSNHFGLRSPCRAHEEEGVFREVMARLEGLSSFLALEYLRKPDFLQEAAAVILSLLQA